MCCLLLPVVDFKKKRSPTWAERWIRWNCLLCYPSLVSIIYTERKKKPIVKLKIPQKSVSLTFYFQEKLSRFIIAVLTERAFWRKHKRILTTSFVSLFVLDRRERRGVWGGMDGAERSHRDQSISQGTQAWVGFKQRVERRMDADGRIKMLGFFLKSSAVASIHFIIQKYSPAVVNQ